MNFKKITFKNGLRLVLIPQPQSLAATVLILVEAGSEYETKNINGLSHFLEHMMFKGTTNRPDTGSIATELEGLGAEDNAFTGQQYTGYYAKVHKKEVDKVLDILSDLYLNPIFNPKDIEKERGVIIEEINMYEDDPKRRVQELLASLLYGDQPAGWDIAGRKEVVRTLKRGDFIKYREKHYVAAKTVVVVAGGFDGDRIKKKVWDNFCHLPKKSAVKKMKTTEKQSRPEVAIKFKDSSQSHLVLGFRAFDVFDKRRYALQLMANLLGGGLSSRLFRRVRDELGAAYYVRADADLTLDHGVFMVSSGVDHNKIDIVIGAVLEEIKKLLSSRVPEEELNKSKTHTIGGFIMGLETSDALAGFYGGQEIITKKITSPEEVIKKIKAVTAGEIQKVARDIFINKNLNLAIIGPYKDEARFRKLLKL